MSGIPIRSCVFGCSRLALFGVPLHRFPNPDKFPDLFAAWVSAVGDFLKETDPIKIYKSKRICDHHFKHEEKTSGGRLFCSAIPTLNLHRMEQSLVTILERDHSYCVPRCSGSCTTGQLVSALIAPEVPSTSNNINSEVYINKNERRNVECAEKLKQRRLQRKLVTIKCKMNALKKQIRKERKESSKVLLDKFTEGMSEPAKLWTRMQFEEGGKKPKGHRFTLKEKVLALSLYKKSPKSYTLLEKYFTIPSKKVLKCLLANIKIVPGINKVIFDQLKITVNKMLPQDRLCTLIFDEMSINPQIQYNCNTDDLVGFENLGDFKTNKLANHVLVFMVKGIKKNYKQPVAYYFTQTLKTLHLKNILLNVIKNVQATGLKIIATVCDQCSTNVSVINALTNEAKQQYNIQNKIWTKDLIICNGQEIIPLFDVPHLVKGIRNNILNKQMMYECDNKTLFIKWEYIQWVYEADKAYGELRLLHKVTREHVDPGKIKKMRVKNAVQVLSHSMAVVTEHLSARGDVPAECRDLIPFLLLIDKLFDSLNASSFTIQNGKMYRAAVKRNSPHHVLWQDAIKVLNTVKFFKIDNTGILVEQSVPTIKNFIKTINGFQEVWRLLNGKYLIDSFLTRNINQDPLENFFGSIRSMGARNVAPNCIGFEGAFKTLLLNNFSANHSINANCEQDSNSCLQKLTFFVNRKKYTDENAPSQFETSRHETETDHDQPQSDVDHIDENVDMSSSLGDDQRIFVCGWALSKCLSKVIKSCRSCRRNLLGDATANQYNYIRAKEFHKNKQWLCYPSQDLIALFGKIQHSTIALLKRNPFEQNIKKRITAHLQHLEFKNLICDTHLIEFSKLYKDIAVNIIIYSWCRSINRILAGKITYDGDDETKIAAQTYRIKHNKK